jgi:hypothetical protein
LLQWEVEPRSTAATRAAAPASPPDERNQRGALLGDAGGRVEQNGLQLPEPDRRDRQADAATIQGKRLWAGRQEAKRRLERVEGRAVGTAHGRLPDAGE